MALSRSVTKHKDILCELCADTYSEEADGCENYILDSDSFVPTTTPCKQLRSVL
jgi:hypothetical protein